MRELDLLKEKKRCLEKALVSNQRMINKYAMEGENLQRKYDEEKLKYDFLSDIPEKKEQFEADVVTGALAFAVGSLPSYLEHSGTISVAITTFIGLGVCGGIVLLRNQPYLSRRKPDFGDLEELELSIYDTEERLKGIDFGTDYLQTRSAHMREAITKIRTQISPVRQKTL